MRITTKAKPATSNHGRSHHKTGVSKFVAIDGEGITLPDGSHKYVLIRCGTNPPLENPRGLHWQEIFKYLYFFYEPGTAYVGFYLGYDFTQIFRTMRENRARKLLTKEGIASRRNPKYPGMSLPVESDGWQFDLLSNRRLRIRPKVCKCQISMCKCPKPGWMYICDSGGFFQTSFLVAINPRKWPEPILSDNEFELIRRGKEHRADASLDDDMRFYNELENEVMSRLMLRVDEGLKRLGVTLSAKQWFSPAQAAQAWMKGRVPTREHIAEIVPAWLLEAARASFIAGWFEIMCHGHIPGITYQYDINSAYPAVAWQLPCLEHATYRQGEGKPKSPPEYCLVFCDVTTIKGSQNGHDRQYIGAMMHRDYRGRISRPRHTGGWYWLHELQAAIDAKITRVVKWHKWGGFDPHCSHMPLRELKDLYNERLRQGKDTPLGRGARLVYNCVYGKLAQNVGIPEFMNFVYASLITAGCRVKILNAIGSHPYGKEAVAQVATDAVYFLSPHPDLPISNVLGEWSCTEHHNLTLFKPGMYWDDMAREAVSEGNNPQFKARGVSASDLAKQLAELDAQFSEWDHMRKLPKADEFKHRPGSKEPDWPSTVFQPSFQMISATQALARNKWHLAGTLMHEPVNQRSNPNQKREGRLYRDEKWGVYRTEPRRVVGLMSPDGSERSHPYEAKFGINSQERDENGDVFGISPDGFIDQLLVNAMMPDRRALPDVEQKKEYNPQGWYRDRRTTSRDSEAT